MQNLVHTILAFSKYRSADEFFGSLRKNTQKNHTDHHLSLILGLLVTLVGNRLVGFLGGLDVSVRGRSVVGCSGSVDGEVGFGAVNS